MEALIVWRLRLKSMSLKYLNFKGRDYRIDFQVLLVDRFSGEFIVFKQNRPFWELDIGLRHVNGQATQVVS